MNLLNRCAACKKSHNCEHVIITEIRNIFHKLFLAHVVELRHVEVINADLKRSNRLEHTLLEVGSDAHYLSCSLHLSSKEVACIRELVEWESWELCNYIVKARLDISSTASYRNLAELHSHGNLSCNSCDRIA